MTDHLYIHVPFCLQKCAYCSFYSIADADDDLVDRYVDAVVAEMVLRGVGAGGWKTVYFGGGTPSLLGADRVGRLLEKIGAPASAEVTLEANPESVTAELLADLRNVGVNRLSLGVQSLVDDDLRYLGRVHDSRRGRLALDLAMRVFERASIDLIYGLPGQTVDGWLEQLDRAAALGSEHLSAYELTYERGTPLGDLGEQNPDRTEFFFATHERLGELGMEGYEVSNFARSAEARSRHNLATWAYRPYLGLGPGAHSFSGPGASAARRWNEPDLEAYLKDTRTGQVPHTLETLSLEQQLLERLMLGLRTTIGIDLQEFPVDTSFLGRLERCEEQGMLRRSGDLIQPTLEGMALADGLAADLLG